MAIVKAKGVDLELSEPQVLAEKVRNPMFLVGAWLGEQDVTMAFVMPHMKGHESQMRLVHLYDFRADGTYASVATKAEDETVTNMILDKSRVFGTWRMDGETLLLNETSLYDGQVNYRNLERRLSVLRYGYDEIGLQYASLRDMKNAQVESDRQSRSNNQFAAQFGIPSTEVGYDRKNRQVVCSFSPYKDGKGYMSVSVHSSPRYFRTAKPSMPLTATAPTSAPQPPRTSADDLVLRQTGHGSNPHCVFERFAWENATRCGFEYRIDGECTLQMLSEIEREVCSYVRNRYLSMHPTADASLIAIDARPSFINGRVVGTGEVLTITLVGTNYDSNTRRGMVSIRFNVDQYEIARVWVRRNIETLARDKNILLTAGEVPPPGSYVSGDERIVDTPNGKVLEMEFKVE